MKEFEMDAEGLTASERKLESLLLDIDDDRYQALVVILGARGAKCVQEMTEYIVSKKPKTIRELVYKFLKSEIVD